MLYFPLSRQAMFEGQQEFDWERALAQMVEKQDIHTCVCVYIYIYVYRYSNNTNNTNHYYYH